MNPDKPIALNAYETLAERYSAVAESKAENGYIEHPAMRKKIGNISGLSVLDAGCGPGFLCSHLIADGATVTGFDISSKMIELAKARTHSRAKLFVADLGRPLSLLGNQKFDLVTSSLAIDYVRDWTIPLKEFWRVLKPKGRLVFSVQHPLGAYLWYKPSSAFGVHYAESKWGSFGGDPVVVPDYYRSFDEIINPVINAGFMIRSILETKPIDALKEIDPENFEKYSRQPTFMLIEASKG